MIKWIELNLQEDLINEKHNKAVLEKSSDLIQIEDCLFNFMILKRINLILSSLIGDWNFFIYQRFTKRSFDDGDYCFEYVSSRVL